MKKKLTFISHPTCILVFGFFLTKLFSGRRASRFVLLILSLNTRVCKLRRIIITSSLIIFSDLERHSLLFHLSVSGSSVKFSYVDDTNKLTIK